MANEIVATVEPCKEKSGQNDRFSLNVKHQYILTSRSDTLPPLRSTNGEKDQASEEKHDDSGKRNKKKRGMNKKRPRDKRIDNAEKMCVAIMHGKDCPYGDTCRFSHDLKAFLASRPEDIKEVEGGCPNFNTYGKCEYAAMCRLGSSHLNMATGENLTKEVSPSSTPVSNLLSKDVQLQLRKNTYPFKCQRHFEKKHDTKNKVVNEIVPETSETGATIDSVKSGTDETSQAPTPALGHVAPFTSKKKIIDFSNKVYVAPLTTVGNLPFRRIMKRFGADITCGEMAVATNLLEGKPQEWALLKRHPEEDIFGVQLAAAHPDQFIRTCELIEACTNVDFVDLNLGCPLDLLCNKGAGACLMLREHRLKPSLLGITSTLTCPVTIKMRTGWDSAKPIAHNLVSKIQSWGLDGIGAVMIHGRSRLQRYSKEADWDYISQVATSQDPALPKIPVIGNGDIYTFEDYEQSVAREGVSSCAMLGRGALIKPWLPTEIKEKRHWDISSQERLEILKDFVRFGLEHWGSDQQGVNNCRRFLLEWMSFLHRYVPVGILETANCGMNQRPPQYLQGRNDLETLFMSSNSSDWIYVSEMLLGPVPEDFRFEPKHKANAYHAEG